MSTITIVMLLVYLVAFGGGGIYMISKSMNGGKSGAIEGKSEGFGSRIRICPLNNRKVRRCKAAMWRFPMMCAKWGGGAFVLAFVAICILIVIPARFC